MAVIYCFGDSITYGAWDVQNSGWVAMLRKYLDDKQKKDDSLYYLTYNLGIPGEDTDGLVKRLESEFKARSREDEEKIFIFAYGTNDVAYIPSKKRFQITKERFEANLEKVLSQALKISSKIILLNIVPVHEDVYNAHVEENGKDKTRRNLDIEEYNKIIAEIAQKYRATLIDNYSTFTNVGIDKLFSEDGLHPNEKGHQLIFEKVKEALAKFI